jgi:hypothetical protein
MNEMPNADQTSRVLEKVSQIAAMAEMPVQRHPSEQMLIASFDMGAGRHQLVYIRYVGETPDGHDSISFMSPCMELKKGGWFGGALTRKRAVDLLRRNAALLFGSFALYTFTGGEQVLVVVSSQIVETMEVEEFRTHLGAVAFVADHYERELGTDVF